MLYLILEYKKEFNHFIDIFINSKFERMKLVLYSDNKILIPFYIKKSNRTILFNKLELKNFIINNYYTIDLLKISFDGIIDILYKYLKDNNLEYDVNYFELCQNIFKVIYPNFLEYSFKDYINLWIKKLGIFAISENDYYNFIVHKNISIDFSISKRNVRQIKTIAMYYNRLYNGGVERVISNLSHIFNEYQYNIIVFLDIITDYDYKLPNNAVKILLPKNNYDRYKVFDENINKYNVDIIIYNDWIGEKKLIDTIIIKYIGISIVCIYHGHFTFSFYYNRNLDFILSNININKLFDYSIVLSNEDKAFYESFGIKNVIYIPNPLPLNNESNSSISLLNTKNIIWIGRFDIIQKQPHLALEVISKVSKKIPDIKLLLVGTGNKEEINFIKSKIKNLKLENNCELIGFTNDISKYFLMSSIHLMTSSIEGFPMVIGESKLYGVPLIMFDLPYLEIIKDNKGVIRIEPYNIDLLSDSIINLLNNFEYRKKLGEDARKSLNYFSEPH